MTIMEQYQLPTAIPSTTANAITTTVNTNPMNNKQQHKRSSKSKNCTSSLRVLATLMVVFSCVAYQQDFGTLTSEYLLRTQGGGHNSRILKERVASPPSSASSSSSSSSSTTVLEQNARIPLPELTRANEKQMECPEGMFHVEIIANATADNSARAGSGRKIPKIIHQTGEQKCMTKDFYDNAVAWSFEGYSYYFHDAETRMQLFQKHWPMFPQLQNSFECLQNAGGAAIADLYRYLIIWEYGGVYADMDDAPNKLFNATTLTPEMDAFFLVAGGRMLSQYFFALSPKHPLMYLAVHDAMEQMHLLDDTGTFYVPGTTGPRCLKRAFLKFMGSKGGVENDEKYWKYRHAVAGTHYGVMPENGARSITVVADEKTGNEWVTQGGLKRKKKSEGWAKMNFTDYHYMNKVPTNKTCLQLILEKYEQPDSDMM